MTPQQFCQEKAAASGSSFYYSFLFLPADQRNAITALYAYCREVDDIVDNVHERSVAQAKLDWWQEEIQRLFHHQARHPVSLALQPHIENFQLSETHFQQILDGMQMDLNQYQYADFAELKIYCHRVASVVGIMAAEIFGYQDPHTLHYAETLGLAMQLTNILRDVREDYQRGRIYIPLDELDKFGVAAADFAEHKTKPNLLALFQHQTQRAQQLYTEALASLPAQDRYPQRSGLIMAEIYRTLLDEIERDGFRLLEQRIHLTPLRKFWIAWKTARREKRRKPPC